MMEKTERSLLKKMGNEKGSVVVGIIVIVACLSTFLIMQSFYDEEDMSNFYSEADLKDQDTEEKIV